ncbi:MAG TPA: hypothetical protein VF954_07780 [Acidimicrobiales bacterium]
MPAPYHRAIGLDDLYDPDPWGRLVAARALRERAAQRVARRASPLVPRRSPGAANAWLVMVTSKEPAWEDPLALWVERPMTLGQPHEGLFYPDRLGFWAEVRRWSAVLVGRADRSRRWDPGDVLSLVAVVHSSSEPSVLGPVLELTRPRVVLFLDEPGWRAGGLVVDAPVAFSMPDPYRPALSYNGFWGIDPTGRVVGKAPQHPASHKLYDARDMDRFLRAVPLTSSRSLT